MFALQHGSSAVTAQPSDGPVTAALRQALTIAEDEASDDDSSIQEVPEQPASPSRLAGEPAACRKQPANDQHSAPPVTVLPSRERSEAEDGGADMSAARLEETHTVADLPTSTISEPAPEQKRQCFPEASGVKVEQERKPSGSIAFTGPVQDVTITMPGIPGSLTVGRPHDPQVQSQEGRPRPARSIADVAAELAAEAEEELRADMQDEQEPPEEDGACADPWAEDPW